MCEMFNKYVSAPLPQQVRAGSDWNKHSAGVERQDIHESIEGRLEVAATREIRYSVIHPAGHVLDRHNPAIRTSIGDRPILTVVDQQVHELYGSALRAYLDHETNL